MMFVHSKWQSGRTKAADRGPLFHLVHPYLLLLQMISGRLIRSNFPQPDKRHLLGNVNILFSIDASGKEQATENDGKYYE
jgi:hypothetical protein